MIQIERTQVFGWEAAIRGMRNPMNSWDKSDSNFSCEVCVGCYWDDDGSGWCNNTCLKLGANDLALMESLAKGGSVHAKYRRMINVTCDITAPLYWWKEFDTYKVGTVANSCSTMHKIHAKDFELSDFSNEHLGATPNALLQAVCNEINHWRRMFVEKGEKEYWWQMIQLLPSSYNQKRTVQLNYEVLTSMYHDRKNHKLDEWREFCKWIEDLPYSELITG
jgi:hypothetical protein